MIVPIRTSLAVLAASMIGDRGIHPVMSYRRRISRDLLPPAGERQRGLVHLKILADTAAVSPDPRERATVARLLGMLGGRPEALLRDEHPGMRARA